MITKNKDKNAIKTSTGKTAYLFGNGINRVKDPSADRYEWSNLLQDLNKEFTGSKILHMDKKPFPMFYDEIVNFAVKKGKGESLIKDTIQKKIELLKTNDRYNDFKNLKCDQILTTNYDYLIEKSLDLNWKKSPVTKHEKFYSLSRYQPTLQTKVWHIHGERADKRSILLGFRHYINYSAKVKERAELCIYGLKSKTKHNFESWVDLFFTHNIKIVGLSMLFTEYPLWWLLAYRHYKSNSDKKIIINNTITLIVPKTSIIEKMELVGMLNAYGIELKTVDVKKGDYETFYKKVLTNNID